MSIFDPNAPTGDTSSPISKEDLEKINLETLVGEGKKYGDADQLAKSYAHADATILQQKQTLADLESQMKVYKDLAEKGIKPDTKNIDANADPDPKDNTNPAGDDSKKDTPSVDDISEQIRQELDAHQEKRKFTSNVDTVSERLAKDKGGVASATQFVQEKAKELNVSTEWLMDVAGRSPDAFYRAVGLVGSQQSQSTPSSGGSDFTIQVDKGGDGNKKAYKYYNELRKTDSKAYYSRQIQSEMMAAASEMGADFYNN